jgi:SsrA-binding protein
MATVASNRKAFHEYEILERLEAGLVLVGTEVKAIRDSQVHFKDSFARIVDGELWLEGCHISPYSHGNIRNHEPERRRKLLLKRREIDRLSAAIQKSGLTLVPLSMYFKGGKVKVELGLGRGKRLHDKRETARRKTIDREIEVEMKRR